MVDYNDKFFKTVSFSENSATSSDTLFHYRQEGDLLQGTYSGGGTLHLPEKGLGLDRAVLLCQLNLFFRFAVQK